MADESKEKSLDQLEQEVKIEARKLDLIRAEVKLYSDLTAIREKDLELNKTAIGLIEKRLDRHNTIIAIDKEIVELQKDKKNNWEEIITLKGQAQKLREKGFEIESKQLEVYKKEAKKLEETIQLMQDKLQATVSAQTSLENSISLLTGVNDQWKQTTVGAQLYMASVVGAEQWAAMFKEQLSEQVTVSNLLGSSMMKVQEMTLMVAGAQDQARADFISSTGAQREYVQELGGAALQSARYGVDVGNLTAAMAQLENRMSMLSAESDEVKIAMGVQNVMLEQLGVSTQATAEHYQTMSKSLGYTGKQTKALQVQMVGLAGSGLPVQQVFEDINIALPQLAQHGEKTIQVFMEMEAASKELNIATSELLGLVKQYDTFEGAATSVGKLNALLGGDYLNSVEMLKATESERIRMLIQSLELSGKNFDSMGRYERMALANAAGITDMAQAQKIFNQSVTEYDRNTSKTLANSLGMTEEQMQKNAEMSQTLSDDLTKLAQAWAVSFMPLIDDLKTVSAWFFDMDESIREFTDGAVGLGHALTGIFMIAKLPTILAPLKMVGSLMSSLIPTFAATTTAAPQAGKGLMSFGASAGKAGASAAPAIPILATIGGVMLATGAAGLMLGAGVKMAAEGLTPLISTLTEASPAQIGAMTASLIGLMLTMASPIAFAAGIGMVSFAAGLMALSAGMDNLDSEGLLALTGLMSEVQGLDAEKVVFFKQINEEIRKTITKADAAAPGALESIARLFVSNTTTTTNAAGVSAGGTGGSQEIIVVVKVEDVYGGKRELSREVRRIQNSDTDIRKPGNQ